MAKANKVQTFTAHMMSKAERAAGISIATLEDPNALGKVDILGALGWVLETKEKTFEGTYDEYMEAHTLEEITDVLELDSEDATFPGDV